MPSRRPTIDDVAALAGVARVTVSRVLNGNPNVRQEVRDRVQKSVDMLQYKVNLQARSLAGGQLHMLAMVYASDVDSEPNSFYQSGLELGALRACTEQGFQLLMQAVDQNDAGSSARVLELIQTRRCDGLILTPPFSDDLDLLTEIAGRKFPVVCISAGEASQAISSGVRIDDAEAGYDLTRYLLGLGHRRFGFLQGLEAHLSANQRFAGFLRALAEHGLGEDAYAVAQGNFTFHSGVTLTPHLLAAPCKPSVIVCANDDMAVGAMFIAHKMGLDIPKDISIVGFDDTPVSEIIWPPLTTVHHPLKAIGYKAAAMVMERITGGGAAETVRTELVPYRLVARESAAAPKD